MDALTERRQGLNDRRRLTRIAGHPHLPRCGTPVSDTDKRKIPDRRLNNIQAEWIEEVIIGG